MSKSKWMLKVQCTPTMNRLVTQDANEHAVLNVYEFLYVYSIFTNLQQLVVLK